MTSPSATVDDTAVAAVKSPVFWRYRPFFDLGAPGQQAPVAAHGPLLAYEHLDTGDWLGTQHSFGERFRASLLRESTLSGYAFATPTQVLPELRTPAWQELCDLVDGWYELAVPQRIRLCRLLTVLGFHRLVLKLVPEDRAEEAVHLAYLRAFCEYILRRDYGDRRVPGRLHELMGIAPPRSRLRFALAMLLLTDSAKHRHDRDLAAAYRQEVQECLGLDPAAAEFTDFTTAMLVARFFRAASYVPYLEERMDAVAAEMTIAERAAEAATALATDDGERLIARETLFFVTESRMREAQAQGDLDVWLRRALRLTDLDPWDPRARIETGEALVAAGRLVDAEREFSRASRLGPPGSAVALYLAGQCRERLGDLEGACDAYYRSACLDASGISSSEGLHRTASATGDTALAGWALARLDHLRAEVV